MPESKTYDTTRKDQMVRIRKLANNAIIIIWTAGFSAISVLTTYFLFFTDHAKAESKRAEPSIATSKLADEALFTDKTTLVNIGLRMQSMPEDAELESSGGTISINKIIHDQKLSKIKKAIKPDVPAKVVKPGFTVKAVPK